MMGWLEEEEVEEALGVEEEVDVGEFDSNMELYT